MNNVQLVGRVAVEPKLRTTGTGKPYMRLVLAVDGYWNRKEKQMTTDFIPVKLWTREATRCQHLMKGSLISITGRVTVSQYEKDGQKQYVTEIIGESVSFLSKPKSAKEVAG
jgi:single-strand DNA-binding protein